MVELPPTIPWLNSQPRVSAVHATHATLHDPVAILVTVAATVAVTVTIPVTRGHHCYRDRGHCDDHYHDHYRDRDHYRDHDRDDDDYRDHYRDRDL